MNNNRGSNGSQSAEQSNMLVKLWKKTGFRGNMIMLSLKGAIPATVALAAYQAPAWASIYTTLGYFVAVIAMLSMAMQPRAKFFQTIFATTIFIAFAAAINLLVILCAVAARDSSNNQGLHTGSSGSIEATPYDSSANAVAAAWLFFNVFGANFLKAKRPQLGVPATQFNFYSIVAAIYTPSFPNMAAGTNFSRRLLITFLTAYAIAIAVNVLIWPTTSRGEVRRQSAELICALKDSIQSYKDYTESFGKSAETEKNSENRKNLVKKLRDQSHETSGLFGKIKLDLEFARKEPAFGKLTPDHLHDLYVGMREVLQPIMGLATFLQIVDDVQHNDIGIESIASSRILQAIRELKADEWSAIVITFRDSHGQLQDIMSQALDHIGIQLKLMSRPKRRRSDIEHSAGMQPGDSSFVERLEQELCEYQKRHDRLVQEWLDQHHANERREHPISRTSSDESDVGSSQTQVNTDPKQYQMYLILYLNFLLYNAGEAVLRQVRFADNLVTDGTMSRTRFIFPGCGPLAKLMMDAFNDPGQDEAMGANANNGSNIWVGDLSSHKKDPEHVSPANAYERITDYLRRVPQTLSSSDASFGLRTAVATLSIGLAGFLARSRPFFLEQRGIWAVSMTAISMTPRLGASVSAFCMRILGTAIAAGLSIAIVYIADHNVIGIIVLFYFQAVGWLLLETRVPSFELTGIVGASAVIIIIGYQLQVDVIGLAASTQNGQAYYPIYLLAVYRLGLITAGLAVAFFWSFFPFPVTSHGSLRQDTANTLYILANYHSCVQATLELYPRIGPEIVNLPDDHPVHRLEEARQEVFGKCILMLSQLREHVSASQFEPRIGGKFPRDQYEQVIESFSRIFTNLTLMTYSSKAFIRDLEHSCGMCEATKRSNSEDEHQWLKKFRTCVAGAQTTSHQLTCTLCLLAASVDNGQPLPPYLSSSRHHDPAEKLTEIAPEIPERQRFTHPCYAAFAVNECAGSLINGETVKLVKSIKDLVGEIDFNYQFMSNGDDSTSTLVNTYSYGMDGGDKTASTKAKRS